MRKSGTGSGGGLGSRNVKSGPARMGQPAREMRPRGVSQIGSNLGNKSMDSGGKILKGAVEPVRGQSLRSVPLGNETAKSTARTVMARGTQGQHGPPEGRSPQAGRDILGAFGPDSAGVRGRR